MGKECPDCGNAMVRRNAQEMPAIDVEVVRWYCDPCRKVITQFDIATEEPLEDAKSLLDQE